MLLHTLPAPPTVAAADVYLPDDAFTEPASVVIGRLIDDANELVTWNALEPGVAFENLQIGPTDARHVNPDAAQVRSTCRRHRSNAETVCGSDEEGFHGAARAAGYQGYHGSVYAQRQLRLRVLESLEQRVKQFAIREDLWPLRVPHEPLSLDDLIGQLLGDEARTFNPLSLRARTLLHLEWDDSAWDAWVIVLPSKLKLFCDTSHEESRILASGGRNEGDESDRIFLERLSDSAGQHFGIEMAGGPPSRVRSSLADRDFLATVFVNLFEVTGMESELRRDLAERGASRSSDATQAGVDLRLDVEQWLPLVLS
jgi:hypothetical protein